MKRVNFTLDCGYRVSAKVHIIHKENGGGITIVSAKFPSLRRILYTKQNTPHFILWDMRELENSYGREIRGKSFCMPEDKYDEDFGIKIAKTRLQSRMNEMVNNRLRKVRKDLEKVLADKLFHLEDI
jgi:hypothetical protein